MSEQIFENSIIKNQLQDIKPIVPPIYPPSIEKDILDNFNFTVNSEIAKNRVETNPSFKLHDPHLITVRFQEFNHEQRAYAFAAIGTNAYFTHLRPDIIERNPNIDIQTIDQSVKNMDFNNGVNFVDLYKIVRLGAE